MRPRFGLRLCLLCTIYASLPAVAQEQSDQLEMPSPVLQQDFPEQEGYPEEERPVGVPGDAEEEVRVKAGIQLSDALSAHVGNGTTR